MKEERINDRVLREMENRLGCVFCNDGEFAEMSIQLSSYKERTKPIENVSFGFYKNTIDRIKKVVSLVDSQWEQYFNENDPVFCGYVGEKIVSFCLVEEERDCILTIPGIRVGSIGCVGTIPEYRGRGIGLRMVDLATVFLQKEGYDKAYIHYTHIDNWYAQLGYTSFARFSLHTPKQL